MLRVFDFNMDGVSVKLSEMSWKQAEEHHKATKELAEKGSEVTNEQWIERTCQVVCESMNHAGADSMDAEKLTSEFGLKTINAMYIRIMEESSLRIPQQGEAKAA